LVVGAELKSGLKLELSLRVAEIVKTEPPQMVPFRKPFPLGYRFEMAECDPSGPIRINASPFE
jgi:hypothetical protein